MFSFMNLDDTFISILSGYNTYIDTGELAKTIIYDSAIVVQHLHSKELYYAVPITTPKDFFNNTWFQDKWKKIIEYPSKDSFIWPVDLMFKSTDVPQCYLVYEFSSTLNYKSVSDLSINHNFLGLENKHIQCIALKFINAYLNIEKNNYMFFGLDDNRIYVNTENDSILIPIKEEIAIDRNSEIYFTPEDYISEVIDPYAYINRNINRGNADIYKYDVFSERYAFLSVLFKLLMGLYPYEGPFMDEYEYNLESNENQDWIFRYLQNPVFIFDMNDKSNSIESYNKNAIHRNRWNSLSEKLKTMFTDSLVQDNVLRKKTVVAYSAEEWYSELESFFNNFQGI